MKVSSQNTVSPFDTIKFRDKMKSRLNQSADIFNYDLCYDKLVIAVGSKSATFNIPGFESQEEMIADPEAATPSGPCPPSMPLGSDTGTDHHNLFFLKQLQHARAIRNRILECFERASNPLIEKSERLANAISIQRRHAIRLAKDVILIKDCNTPSRLRMDSGSSYT